MNKILLKYVKTCFFKNKNKIAIFDWSKKFFNTSDAFWNFPVYRQKDYFTVSTFLTNLKLCVRFDSSNARVFFQRLLSENDRKLVVSRNILGITSCWVQNVNSSEWLRTFLVMHMWELKCGKRTMLIFTFIYASCLMEIVSTFYLKGILFQF